MAFIYIASAVAAYSDLIEEIFFLGGNFLFRVFLIDKRTNMPIS